MDLKKLLYIKFIPVVIIAQTLYFKFIGAPESMYIFMELGVEPAGRIFTAIMETIAVILMLYPRSLWLGALTATGLMGGAILSHLFILGIEIQDDGGMLFTLAIISFLTSSFTLYLEKSKIPYLKL